MAIIFRSVVMLLLGAAMFGCTETRFQDATGEGIIRGVNGIVESSDVIFLIEELTIAQLAYKTSSTQQEYDDLTYNFNFDLPIPMQTGPQRIATRSVDVMADFDYTLVLAGTIANPEIVLWERPIRDWDGTETVFDLGAGHVNNTLGEVDVYFAAPGTVPVFGNAIGSIDFGGRVPDTEFAAGDYEIILTDKDDPTAVRYTSSSITLAGASSYTIAIFDADPGITGPISVRLLDLVGNSLELADVNVPPTAQFVHAAFGSGNIDVAVDGDFINLLVSDLAFGTLSNDEDIGLGPLTYAYVPAGNTTPLFEEDITVIGGTRSMIIVLGEVGDVSTIRLPSIRRGFSTIAQFRLTNATFNGQDIDVYLTDPGDTIDDRLANIFALPFAGTTAVGPQFAQDFEITVTPTGDKTPLVGPVPLTLNVNEVVEIIVLDTADPNVADLLIFTVSN